MGGKKHTWHSTINLWTAHPYLLDHYYTLWPQREVWQQAGAGPNFLCLLLSGPFFSPQPVPHPATGSLLGCCHIPYPPLIHRTSNRTPGESGAQLVRLQGEASEDRGKKYMPHLRQYDYSCCLAFGRPCSIHTEALFVKTVALCHLCGTNCVTLKKHNRTNQNSTTKQPFLFGGTSSPK